MYFSLLFLCLLTVFNYRLCGSGQEFPINPLDVTKLQTFPRNIETLQGPNTTYCVPAFFASDVTGNGVDTILGDAFMRNVYTLFNYGSWAKVGADDPPYIQLISVSGVQAQSVWHLSF